MVYKIEWTRRASVELSEIYQYYYEKAGQRVARRRIKTISQYVLELKNMPNLGRLDDKYHHIPTYRYIVVLDYRVYYFAKDDTINIISVWDCRQGERPF